MRQVIAFIKPNRLPAVTLALQNIEGLPGMSFTEARGFGRERIPKSDPSMVRDLVDYAPSTRIEIFCTEDLVYEVQYVIEHSARNGNPEDSKVFVVDVGKSNFGEETEFLEPTVDLKC